MNSKESYFIIEIRNQSLKIVKIPITAAPLILTPDSRRKCDPRDFTSPKMTALTFFGALFTAYGIPLSLFVLETKKSALRIKSIIPNLYLLFRFIFTIAADPVRVILLMLSAFFWLLSLFLSSILWFAVVPLKDTLAFGLVFSVLFQV